MEKSEYFPKRNKKQSLNKELYFKIVKLEKVLEKLEELLKVGHKLQGLDIRERVCLATSKLQNQA
jgi:hypothetical protein